MRYITRIDDKEFVIEVDHEDSITVNGKVYAIDFQMLEESGILSLLVNEHSIQAAVDEMDEEMWQVLIAGELYDVHVQDERAYRLAEARKASGTVTGEATIKSPMPGIIIKLPAEKGSSVTKGATVAILESMKMENELKAPRAGIISRIHVKEGASVEKGQPLVTISDE